MGGWNIWNNMVQRRYAYVLLLMASSVLTLPTEPVARQSEISNKEVNITAQSEPNPKNNTVIHKPTTVTYILGQSIKNGTVQSPAELLSPDRYEFYTFDDDGQIIKKLMTVEEIQRILASSKEGVPPENHHTDYYQVLSVTPDVDSVPAVKINPNEPLFSIHDVIASVQNVLKAEIKQKMTTPPNNNNNGLMTPPPAALIVDGFQNAHLVLEGEELPPLDNNSQFETGIEQKNAGESADLTITTTTLAPKSTVTLDVSAATGNSTTMNKDVTTATPEAYKTVAAALPPTKKPTTGAKKPTAPQKGNIGIPSQAIIKSTTKTPVTTVKISETRTTTPVTTTTSATTLNNMTHTTAATSTATSSNQTTQQSVIVTEPKTEQLSSLISTETPTTMVQVLRVTSSVSQQTSPHSRIPTVTTQKSVTTTTSTSNPTTQAISTEKTIESTADGPEQNNESIDLTQNDTRFEPLSILDAHPGLFSNSSFLNSEPIFAIESLLFDNVNAQNNGTANFTVAESALSEVQLPMNQDLAESVSSVLSQVANEISLNSGINFDESISTTTATAVVNTEEPTGTTEVIATTSLTLDSSSELEELENLQESKTESTTQEAETGTTSFSATISFNPQNEPMPFSKPVDLKENQKIGNLEIEFTTTNDLAELRTEKDESIDLTTEYPFTTAEPMETTTLTDADLINQASSDTEENDASNAFANLNSSSIEIIQEAETGRIPRPNPQQNAATNRPGSLLTEGSTVSVEKVSDASSLVTATSTLDPVTTSSPATATNITTTASLSTQTTTVTVLELSEIDANTEDEVENISISFVPMLIHPSVSTESTSEPLTSPKADIEAEEFQLPPSEDIIESKVAPDDETEKSSPLDTSHKVIIAALSDKKTTPLVVAIAKEPAGLKTTGDLKQNYAKPQNYVKPSKPVFIKPTKAKPQNLESKPSKLTRPTSSEEDQRPYDTPLLSSPSALELDQAPAENLGLEATTVHLENDVREFVDLCNELAFTLWSSITHNGLSFVRSVVISPFAVTSLLAMVFLGARGPTSGQMNDILKLDDVVTFNPHLVFRNVTESLVVARNPGIATAAFVRELYSDRSKGKLLEFYKERAQQFYDGHVEEVNFKAIGETLRRQTNHLVKRQTWGKVKDFLQGSTLMLRAPLAAFSANIFQADCSRASTKDRDGEMYFVVLPSNRLRRLVPIPAVVWRDDFLAGYEPNLDATVAAVGAPGSIVTTIYVMPGQQGLIAPGDSLARLEHHLLGSSFQRGHWGRILRSLLRRPGLELQVPRLSHKSVVNVTASLQKMGLRDLFNAEKADLTGLNGLANDLHLSDMVQVNMFSTCGDEGAHHTEFYPATPLQRRDKSADNVFAESIESLFAVSDFEDPTISALPLELRPRQARIPSGRLEARTPDPPRLRLDRPFLFFVRHNPSGLILHVGRFNPRLMH